MAECDVCGKEGDPRLQKIGADRYACDDCFSYTADVDGQVVRKYQERNRNCVITTAVCEYFNKPDNCEELQVLRQFRDEYMKTPERKGLVEKYYKLAPQLVQMLKNHPQKDAIYQNLLSKYINPSVTVAKAGNYSKTFDIYVSGVKELQQLLDN